jgi:hypothetical protein
VYLNIFNNALLLIAFKLKSEFLAIQRLRGMSGWSWDDAQHKVTALDDIWDNHIVVCNPRSFHTHHRLIWP